MINAIGAVIGVALTVGVGYLVRRRGDVLDYHLTDTAANRVGRSWLWSRHGGR